MDKLVSTKWLAARLGTDNLVILDATMHLPDSGRDARAEYEAGHIPGARFLDLASLVDDTSDTPRAIPTVDQFSDRMDALGIAPGSRIVIYDDSAIHSSARAWFILDHYGDDKIAILDGGLAKWRAEGRELSQRVIEHSPRLRSDNHACREIMSKAEMLENLDHPLWQVVDARDEARFEGRAGSGSEGHIPGARNLPFNRLLNEDRTYKSPEEIRTEFQQAGLDLSKPIVTSCNSGVTACVLSFGLELLGQETSALYDGSWLEWGGDPDTPKEAGEAR